MLHILSHSSIESELFTIMINGSSVFVSMIEILYVSEEHIE